MGDWFGEGIRAAVLDEIETSVMGQVTIIEDKTDETVSCHE